MPGGVLRKGVDMAGGVILTGSPNVYVNNKPAARVGDTIYPHEKHPHKYARMAVGSNNVYANNKKLSLKGHQASCGHAGTSGSNNVSANKK